MHDQMANKSRRDVLTGLATASIASGFSKVTRANQAASSPNIIFIMADDLGYADLGAYGQTMFKTPNIDKLASQGLSLSQAYSNSAVCSATRVALMTGRYQYRLRVGLEEPIGPTDKHIGLPPEENTLPKELKKIGYKTALIGKWHLGYPPEFSPLKSGYDEFYGNHGGAIDYFSHKGFSAKNDGIYRGKNPIDEQGYYTQLLEANAKDYLSKHVGNEPFFLSLHFTAPHWPWEGPHDLEESKKLKSLFHYDGGSLETYGKMVEALDASIGSVLAELENRGLADNTIVIFTSDNGGERFSNNWPFSGQKTELLEGGIRVPAIIRWPHKIVGNKWSDQVIITMDWVPTLLSATGTLPLHSASYEGIDLLQILKGEQQPISRKLFWRYKANDQRAHRDSNLKYLKIAENEFLFDVKTDPRERADLKEQFPDKFQLLKSQWERWNADMIPITEEVQTHWVKSKHQADHFNPDLEEKNK